MFFNYLIRIAKALVTSALVAAFVVPALALGAGTASAPPDAFERYAAAHPFGAATASMPDVFERYAISHQALTPTDLRSPDTRDAAAAARLQSTDLRSPDTRDVAAMRLAAGQPQAVPVGESGSGLSEVIDSGGFDWRDAAVGAAGALGLILLILLIGFAGHSLRQRGRARMLTS